MVLMLPLHRLFQLHLSALEIQVVLYFQCFQDLLERLVLLDFLERPTVLECHLIHVVPPASQEAQADPSIRVYLEDLKVQLALLIQFHLDCPVIQVVPVDLCHQFLQVTQFPQ